MSGEGQDTDHSYHAGVEQPYHTPWTTDDNIEAADSVELASDELDPSDVDVDSLGAGDWASVASSLYRHHYENGRRYARFRDGTYLLPNDDIEQMREELLHTLNKEICDQKLFYAPIGEKPQRILDLGTGTGLWSMEVADVFPSAEVIGIDISPIQPDWVPSNLKFCLGDIRENWGQGQDFDMIFLRHVCPYTTDVQVILRRVYENLKPGGWIEVHDFGGICRCADGTSSGNLEAFFVKCREAFASQGMEFTISNGMGEILTGLGFVDIHCKKVKVPTAPWPKNRKLRVIGHYASNSLPDFLEAVAATPLRRLGMRQAEIDELLLKATEEVFDANQHCHIDEFFWWAQKPPLAG